MGRFDLSDEEWEVIAPLLPGGDGVVRRGRRPRETRRVLDGILYILRTGAPWRDLPERYGPYTSIYNRFNRWAKAGVWGSVFEALARASPQSPRLIDSSIVRAHQHSAGAKRGAAKRSGGRAVG